MTDLRTLSRDIDRAVTLASNSIRHADDANRFILRGEIDKLRRFHRAILAGIARPCGGPFSTLGCWQTREPGIRDIIRTVEGIAAHCEREIADPKRLGRLRFAHRSGGLRPELAAQSQPSGRSSAIAPVDLRCLNDNPAPPRPAPWWLRNHDLLAMVACICIAAAWALGEWRLS